MKLNYRNELDGLRGIAAIAAVVYHAKFYVNDTPILTGGYLGVDIFFILSGFLISHIIYTEIIEKRFALFNFIERRVRRILPTLLFIIIFSYPFFFLTMIPLDLNNYSKSIFYTLGFLSNTYFHYQGIEYGGISSYLKPFLHTWSVAVEVQLYIIFTIVLFITIKYFKKYLFLILLIGCFVSLSIAEIHAKTHSSFNYYMVFARVWEFSIGSILAFTIIYKSKIIEKISKNLKELLILVSLVLIIFSIVIFDSETLHPTLITLFPVLGVSIIILISNNNLILNKVLIFKPLSYIGLISYSLYLWHYPIFAFARLNNVFDSFYQKIICILISFLLSVVTYHLIEKIFRNKKLINKKIFFILMASGLLIAFLCNYTLTKSHLKKMPDDLINFDFRPWQTLRNKVNVNCHNNPNFCKFIKNKEYKNIYIIGDSHAAVLMDDLKKRYIDETETNLITMTTGCFGLPGFQFRNSPDRICTSEYYERVIQTIKKSKNNTIIIGGRFPLYLSGGKYFNNKEGGIEGDGRNFFPPLESINNNLTVEEGYTKFTKDLLDLSDNFILIYPVPEVGFNVPRKIFGSIDKSKNINEKNILKNIKLTTSYDVFMERSFKTFKLFNKIDNKKLIRIYPHEIFCNEASKRCITHTQNEILYSDDNHLSVSGAKMLNNIIIKELKKLN